VDVLERHLQVAKPTNHLGSGDLCGSVPSVASVGVDALPL
jgi:hypothetical protein